MIKKTKKVFRVLFFLVVILFATKYLISYFLQPTYKGTIELQNLKSEVTINYDDYGIPHIYSDNQEDAQRALGYAHAQDRLWQMELLRRIAPGRLAEIFGEVALESDLLFAGLGIEEASEKALLSLDTKSEMYTLAQAYIDGVNEFIENGPTPIEFYILGIDKKKFELKDSYNIIGYMAFSFAAAHKTDPVLSNLQAKLGSNYIKELGVDVNPNSTLIKNYNTANEKIAIAVANIIDKMPVPAFLGSNSWIVAPPKTKNGNVLFANDPHIPYSATSVWYEAHITAPDYESYGYYLGGVPFPMLSHNREYAYGITMFENDDIDFYQEENHPTDASKYKTKDGYKSYETSLKTINIKDKDPLKLEIRSTGHGPIMNDLITQIESDKPLAMSWIYTQFPNRFLRLSYLMSHAKDKNEFEKGVSLIHAPGLNIMYGNAKGDIAWWAAAQLYKLPKNAHPKFVLDGSNGEHEVTEYLDFNQNPQSHNPPWNYVYSANNQPDSIAGILYPGYYAPGDRGKRIVELLEPKNDWTKEDFMKMILDSKSSIAPELVKIIVNNVTDNLSIDNEKEALDELKKWDGDFTKSSVGATVFTKFIYMYLKNTFEDEIGTTVFASFINTHVMYREISEQLKKEESIWWDNIKTTETKENKSQILSQSFSETVATLENQLGNDVNSWTWNRVHTVTHKHPLGTLKALDFLFNLNIGPYEINGSNRVINKQGFDISNTPVNDVKSGPSTRRIVDFSDIENSMSILPTGNSGNPFSEFYRDQAEMFVNGEFRKMKLNKEEIEKVSTKLIFTPKKD